MKQLHFYINFSTNFNSQISDNQTLDFLFADIINSIDRADTEKGSKLYLDRNNLNQFIDELEINAEIYGFNGTYTITETVLILIKDIAPNFWNESPIHEIDETNRYYKQLDIDGRVLVEKCPGILKETLERHQTTDSNTPSKCAILDFGKSFGEKKFITGIRSAKDQFPTLVNFDLLLNFTQIESWIYSTIIDKNYNYNDNRHIETHPNFNTRKSPLIGGLAGKQNAAALLTKAIGDKRKKDYLVNYDEVNQRYIRYEWEDENPQNLYHGYHLVRQKTHEIDINEVSKVPKRIIKLLNYRKILADRATLAQKP